MNFGLEGFFDDSPSEEMKRNRENVFDILDSAQDSVAALSEKEYAERFERDCREVIGCDLKKNRAGEIIRVKPEFAEREYIKSRYNAVGFSLLVFLLASSLLPYLLIYAAVFGMAFAKRSQGVTLAMIDEYFYDVIGSNGGFMIVNAGTVLISLLLATYAGCKAAKISVKDFFAKPKIGAPKTLAYSSMAFFLQIISGIIITIISELASSGGKQLNEADFSTNRDMFATIVICTYTIIIAPFIEEYFFRGFVLNNVSKISKSFAMVLSAFLFALYHMNIPQFVSAFLMGLLLSYVTLKADSIIPAIVIHSINNCIAMALTILSEYNQSLGDTVSVIVMYSLALIGLVMLVIFSRKEAFPEKNAYDKYRGFENAIKSPSLIIAVALMIGMTAMNMFK